MSAELSSLATKGILHQKSCSHTPQPNGVAERKNRHILETVRALLLESSVPRTCWCEAAHTAVHLINRFPKKLPNNISLFQCLFGFSPYSHSHVFGSLCFVHLPIHERNKLSAESAKSVFVGYNGAHKGFHCYDPTARRTQIPRNVVFLEHVPFYSLPSSILISNISFLPLFPNSTPSPPIPPLQARACHPQALLMLCHTCFLLNCWIQSHHHQVFLLLDLHLCVDLLVLQNP